MTEPTNDSAQLDISSTDSDVLDSPKIVTHTLQRITLINWYLFRKEDLEIGGRSVLVTGRNGAGKSTILDAVQTILAGANEKALSYNAISNDGAAVTRSLQSYCLGEVGENDGGDETIATRARTQSNTYISLTWHNRNGSPYSFGCGFYARKDSRKVDKHFFVVKGYSLSSDDYMVDETTVMPWKDFERRLDAIDGDAYICSSSTEFRTRCCESMSAIGSNQSIAPDILFRTVKKGLQFRQQKNVTEFIRDYILPEREIDVISIENDYKQYISIREEIEDARDRLDGYKRVIKLLEKHRDKIKKAINYDWIAAELGVSEIDLKIERVTEKVEQLEDQLMKLETDKAEVEASLPKAETNKENALLKLNDSDLSARIEKLNNDIERNKQQVKKDGISINKLRHAVVAVEALDLKGVDDDLKSEIKSGIKGLKATTNFEAETLMDKWPRDLNNLQTTINAMLKLTETSSSLGRHLRSAESDYDVVMEELAGITEICRKLKNGQASLQKSSEQMIKILAEAGIKTVPLCDLAEVTDSEWQWGIERFLGIWNREALLIMDGDEVAGPSLHEKALKIYRQAKDKNKFLRSVKILNPQKISPPRKAIELDTAAALVTSDNEVALNFLQRILVDVKLRETESELQKSDRAITKDGMTAGNGAISGGNRIEFVLLGQKARKDQVETLLQRINELVNDEMALKATKSQLKTANDVLRTSIDLASSEGDNTVKDYKSAIALTTQIEEDTKTSEALAKHEKQAELQEAFDRCDKIYNKLIQQANKLAGQIGEVGKECSMEKERLPHLNKALDDSVAKRKEVELDPLYDTDLANSLLEKLEETNINNEANLAALAEQKAIQQRNQSGSSKTDANTELVQLCERHDIENKETLIALTVMEQLEKCQTNAAIIEESEIVIYEQDAKDCQENMLNHFRSGVVSKLQDSLTQLDTTMRELNGALKGLRFNNFEFRFIHKQVETPALCAVYNYTTTVNHVDSDGGLFDDGQTHEGIQVIEDAISDNRLAEIADYRNFFTYDIAAKDTRTGITRTYSELLGTGSEGEKQSPFYVALAASFVNAYKLTRYGSQGMAGGAALALFDEAMSKMDGVNTSAALRFFSSLGLQIIMAAPPETAVKVGTNIPTTMRVTRNAGTVFIDESDASPKAKKLLESDDPRIHPEVAKPFEAAVREEFEVGD